jgi:choline dehydrogenase-like flavoprotein
MAPRQLVDSCDVAVIGSGFGGAIAAFRYAAAGLRVVVLERGARIPDADLRQSQAPDDLFRIYTRYQSTFIDGDGLDVLTGTVWAAARSCTRAPRCGRRRSCSTAPVPTAGAVARRASAGRRSSPTTTPWSRTCR